LPKSPINESYRNHPALEEITRISGKQTHLLLSGLTGSSKAVLASAVCAQSGGQHLFVCTDKETAAYFYNDLENLFGERDLDYNKKSVLFYPTSYKRPYEPEKPDNTHILSRTEVWAE